MYKFTLIDRLQLTWQLATSYWLSRTKFQQWLALTKKLSPPPKEHHSISYISACDALKEKKNKRNYWNHARYSHFISANLLMRKKKTHVSQKGKFKWERKFGRWWESSLQYRQFLMPPSWIGCLTGTRMGLAYSLGKFSLTPSFHSYQIQDGGFRIFARSKYAHRQLWSRRVGRPRN